MTNDVEHLFQVFLGHLYILLGEMSIQDLVHLLIGCLCNCFWYNFKETTAESKVTSIYNYFSLQDF